MEAMFYSLLTVSFAFYEISSSAVGSNHLCDAKHSFVLVFVSSTSKIHMRNSFTQNTIYCLRKWWPGDGFIDNIQLEWYFIIFRKS